jgi:hypothetical protein
VESGAPGARRRDEDARVGALRDRRAAQPRSEEDTRDGHRRAPSSSEERRQDGQDDRYDEAALAAVGDEGSTLASESGGRRRLQLPQAFERLVSQIGANVPLGRKGGE